MIFLILGFASLLVMMGALGMFSRAQISTVKSLAIWIAAIGGLLLATLLFFTRGPLAGIGVLALLGPMVWSWMAQSKPATAEIPAPPPLSRAEAFQILGLSPGATAADIRAAHRRLMQSAHPDHGGSTWLATRINQARDTLLRR